MAETLDMGEQVGDHSSRTSASNTTAILQANRSTGGDGASSSSSIPTTPSQEEIPPPPSSVSDLPCPQSGSNNNNNTRSNDEAATLSQTLEQLDLEEGENGPFNATLDEFLMTALRSSKDRMFLLKLDREFGFFINDPAKNKLEFPTMNSYHRMVIHRVANYFNLRRIVHPVHKTVVLFKTEYSAIPALRFSDLVEEEEEQVVKPFKLLKRNPASSAHGGGESAGNSEQQAAALSEPERRTISIKEREEAYAKARARIFQEGPAVATSSSKTPESSGTTSRCDSPAVGVSSTSTPTSASLPTLRSAEVVAVPDDNDTKPEQQKLSSKPKKQTSSSGGNGNGNSSNNNVNSKKKKQPTDFSQPGSPDVVRSPDALDNSMGQHADWVHSNSSSRNVSRSGSPTPAPYSSVAAMDGTTAMRKPKTKLSKSDIQMLMDGPDGRRRRSTTSTTTTTSSSSAARTSVGLARTESSSSSQDGHHSPGPGSGPTTTTTTIASPAAISPMHSNSSSSASTPPKTAGHDYFGMDHIHGGGRTHTPIQGGRVNSTGGGGMKSGNSGQNYASKKMSSYPPAGYNSASNMNQYPGYASGPLPPPHHGQYTHPLTTGPHPSSTQPAGPWMGDPMQYQGSPEVGGGGGAYSGGPGYGPGGPAPHPGHFQTSHLHQPGFQQQQQRPSYPPPHHHYPSPSQPHVQHTNYYQQQQHQQPPHGSYQQQHHHHHHQHQHQQHYQPYYQPNHTPSRGGGPISGPVGGVGGGNVRPRFSQDHQFHRTSSHKRYNNQVYDPNKAGGNMNGGYYGPGGAPQQTQQGPHYDMTSTGGPMNGVHHSAARPQGQRGGGGHQSKYHGKHKNNNNQQYGWNNGAGAGGGVGYGYHSGGGGGASSGPPWINTTNLGANGMGPNSNKYYSNNINSQGSGYNATMSSPASAHVYDIERRPPKSTELFDPNSPQPSNGSTSTGNSNGNYSQDGGSGHGGSHSATEGGGGGSSGGALFVADSDGGFQQPSSSFLDSAHGVPIVMTRSYSSNSTTSSGHTPTPSSGGGPCPTSKKNLMYDYSVPMTTPYEGVLKGPSQEKSMPEHILELHGFHPEDDFVDDLVLPAGAKLKRIGPTTSSSGSGQYLVIFKNAAVATDALLAFQEGRETWLKKNSRRTYGPTTSSETAEEQQEDGPQQEEARNARFQVKVWIPVLVQSLFPTVGGPLGTQQPQLPTSQQQQQQQQRSTSAGLPTTGPSSESSSVAATANNTGVKDSASLPQESSSSNNKDDGVDGEAEK